MLVQQVDAVSSQAFQRGFHHGANALGAAVETLLRITVLEAELGGDDHLVAHGLQGFAHHLLVQGAVGFGGIEEGDPAREGVTDQFNPSGTVQPGTVAKAQAHAAKAQGGDLQAGTAELSFVHDALLSGGIQPPTVKRDVSTY
ncbi:hypothetical protein D3C72_1702220 [compost metagenome]